MLFSGMGPPDEVRCARAADTTYFSSQRRRYVWPLRTQGVAATSSMGLGGRALRHKHVEGQCREGGRHVQVQKQLSVGVGGLAGSTILLLTVPWCLSVFAGRVSLDADGKGSYARSTCARAQDRKSVV